MMVVLSGADGERRGVYLTIGYFGMKRIDYFLKLVGRN